MLFAYIYNVLSSNIPVVFGLAGEQSFQKKNCTGNINQVKGNEAETDLQHSDCKSI